MRTMKMKYEKAKKNYTTRKCKNNRIEKIKYVRIEHENSK